MFIFKFMCVYVYVYVSLWACLVIELKNYCLKRCENCSLKSVVEKMFFSVYKTKKNVFGIMV